MRVESRRESLRKELAGLEQRVVDARKDLAGWEAKDVHLKTLYAHAEEESKINQSLYDQNFIARPRLLQLESRKAETSASIAENSAEISRAR